MKRKVAAFVLTGCMILLGMAGCSNNSNGSYGSSGGSSGGGGVPPANTIWMQNLAFNPSSITIAKGTTLTWQNKDGFVHTSTSDQAGVWDSGDIQAGASKAVTFSTAGTFHYHCKYHSSMGMTGTVTVQ